MNLPYGVKADANVSHTCLDVQCKGNLRSDQEIRRICRIARIRQQPLPRYGADQPFSRVATKLSDLVHDVHPLEADNLTL